jgi:curved DNA-binding protein CbpA
MKYLRDDIQTLEELKKEYHRLCLKLHPDVGGSNEAMKELNAEYEIMFERVKRIHVNKDGERYERDTEETPQEFQWLINELIKLENITIEIIGCFIWVSGDTKPHKEKLKELGFKWHRKKACWYRSPAGYRRWGGGEYSMDDIRSMYRTIQVNKDQEKKEKETRKALRERGWQV